MTADVILPRTIQASVVAALLLLWWAATGLGWVAPFFLPGPAAVFSAFWQLIVTGAFLPPLLTTAYELAMAFLIAVVLGWVVGYLISRSPFAVDVMEPVFAAVFTIPAILFYPLYVLAFGIGTESKIAIGATIGFFPIVLSTIAGISRVDTRYINAARSMGASSAQMFFSVMLPAVAPVLVNGLRIGGTLTYLVILGAESLTAKEGLGRQIVTQAERMNAANMFGYILIVLIISLVFTYALTSAETLIVRKLRA